MQKLNSWLTPADVVDRPLIRLFYRYGKLLNYLGNRWAWVAKIQTDFITQALRQNLQ